MLSYGEDEGVEYHELGTGWRTISSQSGGTGGEGGGSGAVRQETFTFTKDEEHEVQRRRHDEGTFTDDNYNLSSYTFHYHKRDYSSAAETGTYVDSQTGTGSYGRADAKDLTVAVNKSGTGRVDKDFGYYTVDQFGYVFSHYWTTPNPAPPESYSLNQPTSSGNFILAWDALDDPRAGVSAQVGEVRPTVLPDLSEELLEKVKEASGKNPGYWSTWDWMMSKFGGPNHEQPGFLEHMIPGWGPMRSANAHSANGEPGWAVFEIFMGATELATLGVGKLVTTPLRWGARALLKPAVKKTAVAAGKELAEQAGRRAGKTLAKDALQGGAQLFARQAAKQGAALIGCFAAGTPILTPDGHKNIEELRVGDMVLAAPEELLDALIEPRRIVRTVRRLARMLNLHVGDKVIRTSGEHPFYVYSSGWVAASELRMGDFLRTHDDRWIEVKGIADSGEYTTVYNAEVEEYHTYFIGAPDWGFSVWAHNNNPCMQAVAKGWTYTALRRITAGLGRTFVQVHHLIEKRFASLFGQEARQMLSQIVTTAQHQIFTNRWREAIPYGAGTGAATRESVEAAARWVYRDFPDILRLLGL